MASPLTSVDRFAEGPVRALLIRLHASYHAPRQRCHEKVPQDYSRHVRTHRKVDRRRGHLDGRAEGLRVDHQGAVVDRILDSLEIPIVEVESATFEAGRNTFMHERVWSQSQL
jgi:hypothetical protein